MDYYKDNGHLFAKLFHSFELPNFAKEGSYFDTLDELSDQAFALPAQRLFPINDRANTFVSYAYAYAQRSEKLASSALDAIAAAADMFGVAEDLEPLRLHIDSMIAKQASESAPAFSGKTAAFQVHLDYRRHVNGGLR